MIYILRGAIMGGSVIFKKQIPEIKKLPKKFYNYRILAAHLGGISTILGFIIIKNLGVSTSILLSFVGIGMTLIFSWIILKDKPNLKNIMLTLIVSTLVGLGYYFK